MSTSNYAQVTVMDGVTTSAGVVDATAYFTNYRFVEGATIFTIVGTKASAGADNVILYVSPDATRDYPSGTFAQLESFTTTSWAREVVGPWSAFKVAKTGTQAVKVVALVNGRNKSNEQV